MKVSALLSGGTREGAKLPTFHTLHYWPLPLFSCLPPLWGIFGKSWWGCTTRFSNSGSYFRQKLSLSTPVFSPKITYICLKYISNSHVILLSCSFGIKMTNTFIHSRSSLANHSWFQTKMCKVYTFFRLKRPNNPPL